MDQGMKKMIAVHQKVESRNTHSCREIRRTSSLLVAWRMRSTSSAGVPDVRLSSPSSYPKRAPAHNQFIIEVRCEDIKMSDEYGAPSSRACRCLCTSKSSSCQNLFWHVSQSNHNMTASICSFAQWVLEMKSSTSSNNLRFLVGTNP